jgi:hypothetical protein
MNWQAAHFFPSLLRGEPTSELRRLDHHDLRQVAFWLWVTVVGSALFGAAIGCWRSPLQAFYTAIKLPLLIVLTALGNALLNGMLAPQLGVRLGVRESLLAVLISFAITAAILAAGAPLLFFIVWNVSGPQIGLADAFLGYQFMQLMTVLMIAGAGIAGNLRLLPLLRTRANKKMAATLLMLSWLGGNLLLGSQLCWLFRPYVGRPQDTVSFLMEDPFQGNFFEEVFAAIWAVAIGSW